MQLFGDAVAGLQRAQPAAGLSFLFPLSCFATGTFILVLQPQRVAEPAALG